MKVVKYNSKRGVRHGIIVKEGRKWTQLILIEHPIRITKVLNEEQRSMTEVSYRFARAKRIVRDMVKSHYGTIRNAPKNVRAVLK